MTDLDLDALVLLRTAAQQAKVRALERNTERATDQALEVQARYELLVIRHGDALVAEVERLRAAAGEVVARYDRFTVCQPCSRLIYDDGTITMPCAYCSRDVRKSEEPWHVRLLRAALHPQEPSK